MRAPAAGQKASQAPPRRAVPRRHLTVTGSVFRAGPARPDRLSVPNRRGFAASGRAAEPLQCEIGRTDRHALLANTLTPALFFRVARRCCAHDGDRPGDVDEQSGTGRAKTGLDAALVRAPVQTMDRLRAIHSFGDHQQIARPRGFSRPLAAERPVERRQSRRSVRGLSPRHLCRQPPRPHPCDRRAGSELRAALSQADFPRNPDALHGRRGAPGSIRQAHP